MRDELIAFSAAIVRRRAAPAGTGKKVAAERFYRSAWEGLVAASGLTHGEASRRFTETTNDYNTDPSTSERATPGNALPAPLVERLAIALESSE